MRSVSVTAQARRERGRERGRREPKNDGAVIRAVLPDPPPWSFCIFVPELVPTRSRQTRVHAERPDNGKHHSPPHPSILLLLLLHLHLLSFSLTTSRLDALYFTYIHSFIPLALFHNSTSRYRFSRLSFFTSLSNHICAKVASRFLTTPLSLSPSHSKKIQKQILKATISLHLAAIPQHHHESHNRRCRCIPGLFRLCTASSSPTREAPQQTTRSYLGY